MEIATPTAAMEVKSYREAGWEQEWGTEPQKLRWTCLWDGLPGCGTDLQSSEPRSHFKKDFHG